MGEAITAWTRQHDKRSVMQTLSAAGIACGMVLDTTEVLADPHLRERGTVFNIDHPTRGRMSMIGCPLRLSDSPVENRRAPMLGEHTGEVLQELFGYTAEDLARVRRDKVIR
jgi:formyl-CoA transferase